MCRSPRGDDENENRRFMCGDMLSGVQLIRSAERYLFLKLDKEPYNSFHKWEE